MHKKFTISVHSSGEGFSIPKHLNIQLANYPRAGLSIGQRRGTIWADCGMDILMPSYIISRSKIFFSRGSYICGRIILIHLANYEVGGLWHSKIFKSVCRDQDPATYLRAVLPYYTVNTGIMKTPVI